jgi:hypothetical protein
VADPVFSSLDIMRWYEDLQQAVDAGVRTGKAFLWDLPVLHRKLVLGEHDPHIAPAERLGQSSRVVHATDTGV